MNPADCTIPASLDGDEHGEEKTTPRQLAAPVPSRPDNGQDMHVPPSPFLAPTVAESATKPRLLGAGFPVRPNVAALQVKVRRPERKSLPPPLPSDGDGSDLEQPTDVYTRAARRQHPPAAAQGVVQPRFRGPRVRPQAAPVTPAAGPVSAVLAKGTSGQHGPAQEALGGSAVRVRRPDGDRRRLPFAVHMSRPASLVRPLAIGAGAGAALALGALLVSRQPAPAAEPPSPLAAVAAVAPVAEPPKPVIEPETVEASVEPVAAEEQAKPPVLQMVAQVVKLPAATKKALSPGGPLAAGKVGLRKGPAKPVWRPAVKVRKAPPRPLVAPAVPATNPAPPAHDSVGSAPDSPAPTTAAVVAPSTAPAASASAPVVADDATAGAPSEGVDGALDTAPAQGTVDADQESTAPQVGDAPAEQDGEAPQSPEAPPSDADGDNSAGGDSSLSGAIRDVVSRARARRQ